MRPDNRSVPPEEEPEALLLSCQSQHPPGSGVTSLAFRTSPPGSVPRLSSVLRSVHMADLQESGRFPTAFLSQIRFRHAHFAPSSCEEQARKLKILQIQVSLLHGRILPYPVENVSRGSHSYTQPDDIEGADLSVDHQRRDPDIPSHL